jgi:hypothetical protein
MIREKLKRPKPQGESTEAGHWDGPTRSSDEGSVIGLERRGRVRQWHDRYNWKQDDLDACDKQTGLQKLAKEQVDLFVHWRVAVAGTFA